MIDKIGELTYKSINAYGANIKPIVNELKFKEQYQGRIIDCMVGEVDDNYIETPETDAPVVKLEHSKEGLVKVPSIKGKTILVDADGNETDTPAEGCRLVSVGEDEDNRLLISSKNKNLFTNVKTGKYYGGAGDLISEPDSSYSEDYIKVKEGETFIANHLSSSVQIMEYDTNKKLIQRVNQISTAYTVPNGVEFIRLSFYRLNTILENKLQFERGNIRTSYVEPQSNKTEILLDEPLRSLPNGVCDEIVGNQLIHRVGRKIIDGSENWANASGYPTLFYLNVTNIGNGKIYCSPSTIPNIRCNEVKVVSYSVAQSTGDKEICVTNRGNSTSHSIAINIPNLKSHEVNKVKEWLQENPIEIFYELLEPIIEELPNSITLQGFDDTTMYIENSITPTVTYGYNALIPYKQALKEQKEEVETNTLDIEQNIIPYLMDMEFNLMLMEGE